MMCKCGVVLSISVVILSSLILLVTSFNVDTYNYVQHNGPEDSMFGFSVATHKEHGRNWVLVGAPTSQGNQSRIHRGGVVFKCSTTSDNGCEEIDFHQEKGGPSPPDDKNNQWFGATVSSAGPDGPVVACAPRYLWFTMSREERRDPVGTCYIAKDNFRKFSEYSPCRTSLFGYHRQGSCQAGFSAGISKDGKRLFVGAPGSWYWQGQMYSIDPNINFPYTPGIFGEAFGLGTQGQVIQQSLDDRPAVMQTPEGPAIDDDSYMGYSMVVGDFDGAGVQGIAVGMPKGGKMLEGQVLLYTWDLTNYLNISGHQMGSYFGYAVATSDIDGDHRDDLIIGAPMHTEPNTEMKYEVGRVYIAYQGKNGSYTNRAVLDGLKSNSRFGLSLSTLGDLNLDGFGDFAVGAPYDGPHGRGAVYIFQGSKSGVIMKYSQVIYAENVQGSVVGYNPLSTFGFSIAGGLDLDGNDYPDLAIGAYLSDTAYFFRARPVVRVEASVKFDEKIIRLDRQTCDKPENPKIKVPCTRVQVCLGYTGIGAPPRIDLNLQYILDVQKSYSRMYLSRGSGKEVNATIPLFKDAPLNCDLRDTVYLKESIADKLTDLEIHVKYSLRDSERYYYQRPRDPRAILLPIIDLATPAIANDTITIFKNCGLDNICIPDLHLTVQKTVTKYWYDADKPIEFDIEIKNSKDDSYNTKFYVHLPQDIEFRGAPIYVNGLPTNNLLPCSRSRVNDSIFSCDVGNPFVKNARAHFKLRVAPKRGQDILKPTYVFFMNVTSANPEESWTMGDNSRTISIDIWVDAILAIEGKSSPATVYYNLTQYNTLTTSNWDTEIGPPVVHSYTVINKGPSDVKEVEIYIIWPRSTGAGDDLLYLLDSPHTLGGVKCDKIDANYGELSLALQRDIWEVIGIHPGPNGTDDGGEKPVIPRPVPADPSNKITRTITVLMFYDVDGYAVHRMEVIGEPGLEEYLKEVSIAASNFTGPLKVQGNSSSLIIEYSNGIAVKRTIISRAPGPQEVPYLDYQIKSNVTTLVHYYDIDDNFVYTENITERPGSVAFKDRIKSTKDRLKIPLKIQRNTTWDFEYLTSDGKIHHYILNEVGSDIDSAITSTVISTIVTVYDVTGTMLYNGTVEGELNTKDFWERINKIIIGFNEPISLQMNSTKEVVYIIDGKVVRRDKTPVAAPIKVPFKPNSKTTTTIKVTTVSGNLLFVEDIPGEKGSAIYNEHYNKNILSRIKEPVFIETITVYTITYSSPDGMEIYKGTYTETEKVNYTPRDIEGKRESTITTIIFYDAYRNIVHQENITEAVGSHEYWNKINALVQRFQQQQITFHVTTRTIITYYSNGVETHSQEIKGPTGKQEVTPQIVITTTIRVRNFNGHLLHEETVPGKKESVYDIIGRFNEDIIVEIETIYSITYSSDGRVIYTGSVKETKTETYHRSTHPPTHPPTRPPSSRQTNRTSTITTIIFYDVNRNIVYKENITAAIGSEAYWERINGLISRYQQHQVNVEVTTRTIITYYVDGQEVGNEEIRGSIGRPEISYRPQTVITTRIIVYGSNGQILYDESTAGRIGSIDDIINRFNEDITVEIETIYTILYYGSDGQIVHKGTFIDRRTEKHSSRQRPGPGQTTTRTTITTIIFYDVNRNIIHQEDISDEPNSPAYWEKIHELMTSFQRQQQQITIHIVTRTIIKYIVNGQVIRTEEERKPSGQHEASFTPRIVVTSAITVYNLKREVLFKGTVSGEKGTTEYDNYIRTLINRFREPITISIKTTYTITYYDSEGRIVHTARDIREETNTYNHGGTPEIRISTVITFYGPNGDILRQETIAGEPKTAAYWEHIKKVISDFDVPVSIHTNSSKIITYYVDGIEAQTEHVPGVTIPPFSTHFEDIVNVVTYYDANRNELYRETIRGKFTLEDRRKHKADFAKRYGGSFTMEIDTTETVTYRSSDGEILHSEPFIELRPVNPGSGIKDVVTSTTFTVYGPDATSIIHQETTEGEPGSASYNNVLANIISRFSSGSFTIRTNSTKTITLYTTDGRTLDRKNVFEPQSTIQRQASGTGYSSPTTTITFYGPDGRAIHHDTIEGSQGPDLYNELNQIARDYGGVVKSYGGEVNEDGSIGGPVTIVDTPYPRNRPKATGQHFTDFDTSRGQRQSHWSAGFNQSYQHVGGRQGGGHGYASDSPSQGFNIQDSNVNQDLGSFAKGKGFRTGGVDLGITNRGSVDRSIDGKARSNLGTFSETQSYDGNHNYLSGVESYQHDVPANRPASREQKGRRKREVDVTDSQIKRLEKCTTSKCFTIKCTSGSIQKGHEVHIALRARVVVQTLKNISMTQPVNIQSMLLARISRFQEISGSPAQRILYRHQAITSVMAPLPDIKPDIVPLWVVILSAVAGTLILLLLIFLLHKCGFFKRNRPSDAPERQPLNRNGHFQHGDEAL